MLTPKQSASMTKVRALLAQKVECHMQCR